MKTATSNKPSTFLVVIAFVIVYVVWGSTYFFIQMAVHGFPPMLMGAVRFFTAGILLLTWCQLKGDKLWVKRDIITSAISGLLMLFVGTGIVFWAERTLPSAMVAILVSANPIWFVILDRINWKANFKSRTTIAGLILGFAGVILLFGEAFSKSLSGAISHEQLTGLILLLAGPIAWSAGSLVSKKRGSDAPARVNTSWQMIISGLAFIPASLFGHELGSFHLASVPLQSWLAIVYLIFFGSIAAFSAYVWLLKVRPATEVSTHSYVNPVIAVLLGILFAHENISVLQIFGLIVILISVLLVNMAKYGKITFIRSWFKLGSRNDKLVEHLSPAQRTKVCLD
ncbi:EamA family transporter [Mucilaginibacter sp. SG564]|uniref:EamA family transporter n=1 Tax=unclassified Mucilaginibacter TaxID=2617802 RepID=UPI0015559CF4|nr:EamA family transporter [Mucilaginibacter sp. SG564]NOW96525.1 drug/metabolite transporter (DMT)-like permease [Mucilaginibacter sp. SG564]